MKKKQKKGLPAQFEIMFVCPDQGISLELKGVLNSLSFADPAPAETAPQRKDKARVRQSRTELFDVLAEVWELEKQEKLSLGEAAVFRDFVKKVYACLFICNRRNPQKELTVDSLETALYRHFAAERGK